MGNQVQSSTDWGEVHRLAELMRTIGRRTTAAIDEEYRLAEAGRAATSSFPPDDRPSSYTGAGPSTSTGAIPSTSAGGGPSSFPEGPPSTFATRPSPTTDQCPLESIDDFTIVMDDVGTTQSPPLDPTPTVPTTAPASQEEITVDVPPRQYARKRARARFEPSVLPPAHLDLPRDPPLQLHPIAPQTQEQVEEGRRRNPPRNRRHPRCGTE